MNAIICYANLMLKSVDDKERCLDYLSKIISSSDFLLDLINSVLEMARIESGKMVLDEAPMGTVAFNDSLYAVFSEGMKQKNITYPIFDLVDLFIVFVKNGLFYPDGT